MYIIAFFVCDGRSVLFPTREKAAELKRSGGPKPHSHISPISADRSPSRDHTSPQGLLLHSTPSGQPPASLVGAKRGRVLPHLKPSSCHNTDDYPSLRGLAANDSLDNLLPLASYLSSPTGPSYAQVTRNPKRTLIDRCTSPNDGLVKRSATCDIVKTPTEFNKRLSRVFQNLNGNSIQTPMSWDASPQCNITPESCRLVLPLPMYMYHRVGRLYIICIGKILYRTHVQGFITEGDPRISPNSSKNC